MRIIFLYGFHRELWGSGSFLDLYSVNRRRDAFSAVLLYKFVPTVIATVILLVLSLPVCLHSFFGLVVSLFLSKVHGFGKVPEAIGVKRSHLQIGNSKLVDVLQ